MAFKNKSSVNILDMIDLSEEKQSIMGDSHLPIWDPNF